MSVAPVQRLRRMLRREPQPHPDLLRLTAEDRRYMTALYDDTVPLPPGAESALSHSSPRLAELREAYRGFHPEVFEPSRWTRSAVESFLELSYFRGETLITWHYRELPRVTALKYFLYAAHVRDRDQLGLLDTLTEDGAFGCWTFEYHGYGRYSRDLLDSAGEISFLERELQISSRRELSVLDIGAGYGRLGHRMTEAGLDLADYCCVDAVPESTFLSEYYLGHRGCAPPARVVPLHHVEQELSEGFDLALNVHSFSECTYAAVAWWVRLISRLRIPYLMIVPNEPAALLTLETDGRRRDFAPLLAEAGYELVTREPVITDQAIRELVQLEDRFHLYALQR